jgi:uncharacterized protein YegJ (DUF2314 family)
MKRATILLLLSVSLSTAATNKASPPEVDDSTADAKAPCQEVKDDDAMMDRAVAKARESLGFFLAALKANKSDTMDFEVKKCVVDGENVEHLWVGDITWDGKAFHGHIDNEPLDVTNVAVGRRVTVSPEDLTDWMFIKNGKLMGGFTMRVLYSRLSADDKAKFDQQAGFKMQ